MNEPPVPAAEPGRRGSSPVGRSPPSLRRRDALAPRRAHRESPRPPALRPASGTAPPQARGRPQVCAGRRPPHAPLGRAILKSDLGLARNSSV